ncbi:MAG TPA: transcription elongation factor GreA [Clostridia bacterium]|nr:transcription elongation factor GreA [Clostridia bacterium]HOL61362.1 transcription elongation factor GreA [Clostridia bacterium]HPO54076.1 transcription elongation factor GreA [Clostridia bacterium]
MEKTIPLTQQKYDELTQKLRYLETVKRTEVSEAIKAAKEFGDLSENAEYSAAKDAQEKLEIEIAKLSEILAKAYPIDVSLLNNKTVAVGNYVTVLDMEFDEEIKYQIVSSYEASSSENKISDQSPIGKALIGRSKGEVVISKTPGGSLQFKILDISK